MIKTIVSIIVLIRSLDEYDCLFDSGVHAQIDGWMANSIKHYQRKW